MTPESLGSEFDLLMAILCDKKTAVMTTYTLAVLKKTRLPILQVGKPFTGVETKAEFARLVTHLGRARAMARTGVS